MAGYVGERARRRKRRFVYISFFVIIFLTVIYFSYNVKDETKGINDETFRSELLKKHGVNIAGGAANLKDKIFRIGSLGSVSPENVLKTVTGISDTINMMGTKNGWDINTKDIINETKHNLGIFD